MDRTLIFEGLKKYFKFDSFKSQLQEDAVIEICERKHDVYVSMPTGSGKSLCYQLPAVLYDKKITLVFSPLLALIKDQIDTLLALKIRAASLNSKITKNEREKLIADLKSTSPNTKLLYITPEQAATNTFKELFQNLCKFNKVAYIIVDEAHCVSEWGHDFRPDYLKLGDLRENCSVPCVALTATAGKQVTEDIIKSLKLASDHKVFKTSCFRENLFYDVYFPNILENPFIHLKCFIESCLCLEKEADLPKNQKSCGIIYCRTREQTEVLASKLNSMGIKSLCYHAGLKNKERLEFQEMWQQGDVPVICATISFGMGVDKATVRFVVHWGVPKDPASFYQETGRAGRDGKPSWCRVYYNRADSKAIEFHLTQDLGKASGKADKKLKVENAVKGFKKVVEYCENPSECRHVLFSNYFGEPPPKCKRNCDWCKDKKSVTNMVETFLIKSVQYNTHISSYNEMDYGDLYGEGRKGINDESSIRKAEEDDNDDNNDYHREQQAKKETNAFIQKQLALRRNPQEVSQKTVEKIFSKHARVHAAASSSCKVNGLTLATREQYVSKILDTLYDNYQTCVQNPTLDRKDIEDCSVDLEYSIFQATTTMTMYRNGLAKLVLSINKCTTNKTVYDKLLSFQPKPIKHETLIDLFRNCNKKQQIKNNTDASKSCSSDSEVQLEGVLNEEGRTSLTKKLCSNVNFQSASNLLKNQRYKATVSLDNMSNTTDKKSLFGESDEESVRKDQDSDEKRRHKDRKRDKKHNQDRERSSERKKHHKDRSEKRRHSSDKNNERDEDRKRRKRHENESDIYLGDIVRKERLSQENGANKQNLNETLGLTSENGNSAQSNNKDSDEIALNNKNSAGNQREDLTNALTETHNNDGEEIDNLQQSPKLVIDTKGERNVQQQNNTDISNANSNKPKLKKKEVGLLVVKLLTPAYIDKRFESREIFKAMARKISHHLANKDEEEIKDYVKRFLNRNLEITSKTSI